LTLDGGESSGSCPSCSTSRGRDHGTH